MWKLICKITLFAILLITWGCGNQQGSFLPEESFDGFAQALTEDDPSDPEVNLKPVPINPEAEAITPPSISLGSTDDFIVAEVAPTGNSAILIAIEDEDEDIRENLDANDTSNLVYAEAEWVPSDGCEFGDFEDLPANYTKEDAVNLIPVRKTKEFLDSKKDDDPEDSDDD